MKNSSKGLLIIVILVILLGIAGAHYFYRASSVGVKPVNSNQSGTSTISLQPTRFGWVFTSQGEDPQTSSPTIKVIVTADDKKYTVGTYDGSCAMVDSSKFIKNQIAGALCWWAGIGDEFAVIKEDQAIVVKHREVSEGTSEVPEVYTGNYTTVLTIN